MIRTSLTGISAASRDLGVISNNLANAMTTGFKRSMSQFADVARNSLDSTTEAGSGVRATSVRRIEQQGAIENTNNALDLAINGAGYFTFGDPKTQPGSDPSYTFSRAGKLTLGASGTLIDQGGNPLLGLPVLSSGGSGGAPQPINLQRAVGGDLTKIQSIGVDAKGVLSVQTTDGKSVRVAAVAIASFRNEQGLKPVTGSRLTETDQSGPPEFSQATYNGAGETKQGALEAANVDVTDEMLRMIQAQQAYNGNARALQTGSEMLRSTIETLGR